MKDCARAIALLQRWSIYREAAVDQWGLNGSIAGNSYPGANQKWTVNSSTGELVNNYSGMCLTTDGRAGDQLFQDNCSDGWNQTWVFHTTYGHYYYDFFIPYQYIINPASQLAVDVYQGSAAPGGAVIGWPYDGGYNQLWQWS